MGYLDAVVDKDYMPVFNGTPEETRSWLAENKLDTTHRVVVGTTLLTFSIEEYMSQERNRPTTWPYQHDVDTYDE